MKFETATIILYFITCIESRIKHNVEMTNNSSRRFYYSIPERQSRAKLPEFGEPRHQDDKYLYMLGDDGITYLVNTEDKPDVQLIADYTKEINNNGFLLYTRNNRYTPQILIYGEAQTILDSNFIFGETTIVLSHGWRGNSTTIMNKLLTKAFLDDGNVNVIVFDWSGFADKWNYATVKGGTAAVGRNMGKFLNWLNKQGYALYHKMHLVGHSLGGHVVGNAGRETGGAVARITGLDPAGVFWYYDEKRLNLSDGVYVEVIHTSTALLGIFKGWALGYWDPCGDADFYPNGGSKMPGCSSRKIGCSHSHSYELMASSIANNRFYASKCADLKQVSKDTCTGPKNLMGNSELYKSG